MAGRILLLAAALCTVVRGAPAPNAHDGGPPPAKFTPAEIAEVPVIEERGAMPPGGRARYTLTSPTNKLYGVSCRPNGEVLAVLNLTPDSDTPPPAPVPGAPPPAQKMRIWRLSPNPGPHPINRVLEKHEVTGFLLLSPDGKTASFSDTKGVDHLLDIQTGKEVPAATLKKGLGADEKLFHYKFSQNGRFAVFSRYQETKDSLEEDGIVVYDIQNGTSKIGPKGYRKPRWVSSDGKLFAAETVVKDRGGKYHIVDIDGKKLYPMKGAPALASSSSVSMSDDGKRLLLETYNPDTNAKSIRVYALPDWKLIRETAMPEKSLDTPSLSHDGRAILNAMHVGEDGMKYSTYAVSVASGETLTTSETTAALAGDRCGPSGGMRFSHSQLGEQRNPFTLSVQLSDLPTALAGEPTAYRRSELPKLIAQAAGRHPQKAWAAIEALRAGNHTKKEISAAFAKHPFPALSAENRKRLASLEEDLGSERFAVREAASRDARLLIQSGDGRDYAKEILPVLQKAAKSADLEVRRRAENLLQVGPGETNPSADRSIAESRLADLDGD